MKANSPTRRKLKHLDFTIDQHLSILKSASLVIFYSTISYRYHHKRLRNAMKKLSPLEAKVVDKKLNRQQEKMKKAWRVLQESLAEDLE